MRFILNFIFFGILFYLIWMYFPDAFSTLLSWANHVVAFFREIITQVWEKSQNYVPHSPTKPPETPNPSWLILLSLLKSR